MTRVPQPWLIERHVLSFNGDVWLFPTREQAWAHVAGRWNREYASEEDDDLLNPFDEWDEKHQCSLDSIRGWFTSQFDAMTYEVQQLRLTEDEAMALGADEVAFQAWRSTGRDVWDLRDHADVTQLYPDDRPEPVPGRLYDVGFIERVEDNNAWDCIVGNMELTDVRLEKVERFLWDKHARAETFHSASGAK